MSRGRRPRDLSAEERALWDQVADSAKPLKLRSATTVAAAPTPKPTPAKKPSIPVAARSPPPAPTPPALSPMDRRTRTRLSRGALDVDGRLDLHGLTQSSAHLRLRRFLEDAQNDGARLMLVITGKGKPEDGSREDERGVLRRAVPGWLQSAEFRPFVAGFEEAGRRHGGGGALYVRLRRKRPGF